MDESLSNATLLGFKQLQILKAFTRDKKYTKIMNSLDTMFRDFKNEISSAASRIFSAFDFNPKEYADKFLAQRAAELAEARKKRRIEEVNLYYQEPPTQPTLPYTVTKPVYNSCPNCEKLQIANSKLQLESDQKDREIQMLKFKVSELTSGSMQKTIEKLRKENKALENSLNDESDFMTIFKLKNQVSLLTRESLCKDKTIRELRCEINTLKGNPPIQEYYV